MKFITKTKLKLAKKMGLKLAEIKSGDVVLYLLEGEEPEVGSELFVMDDEGNYILPPDGEYEYEDKVLVVAEGIVTEIRIDTNLEAFMGLTKKLEGETVTVEEYNALIDVIYEMAAEEDAKEGEWSEGEYKPEDAPAETTVVVDTGDVYVAITEELKAVKSELSKVKADLAVAKKTSNRDFTAPNPKPEVEGNVKRESSLAKFGLKAR